MKKIWILGGVMMAVASSCRKDHDHESEPEIVFFEPADQQRFSTIDTIRIRAVIRHKEEMHTYLLVAENVEEEKNDTLIHSHDHSKNIDIDIRYFPGVSDHRHFRIRIVATDHDQKTAEKHITIHVE